MSIKKFLMRYSFSGLSRSIIYGIGILLALLSCQDDLCYNHNHAGTVLLDFSFSPKPEEAPQFMNVHFYPTDGGDMQMYQTFGSEPQEMTVPYGGYRVISVNADSDVLHFYNTESWNDFFITTRIATMAECMAMARSSSSMPRATGTEEENVELQPDDAFEAATDVFNVEYNGGTVEVPLPENNVTYQVKLNIFKVKNLEYVTEVGASITGMSDGYYPGLGTRSSGTCTLAFDCDYSVPDSTITGHFTTFGHCPDTETAGGSGNNHKLVVYFVSGGQKYYSEYDVTKQMHSQSQPKPGELAIDLDIKIDDLPVPVPVEEGGAFKVDTDGWENIDVPVVM